MTWSYTYEQTVTLFYPLANSINIEPIEDFYRELARAIDKEKIYADISDAERYPNGFLLRFLWQDYVFEDGVLPDIDANVRLRLQEILDNVIKHYLVEEV